jgi:hypothetical protein
MMVQERKNRLMAYRVEKGLMVQKQISTRAAAAYLANYGVPMHVSVRVLTSSNKRAFEEHQEGSFWFDIIRGSGMTYGA